MDVTFSEATAIDKVRRMVTLWQRNILTEAEVVRYERMVGRPPPGV